VKSNYKTGAARGEGVPGQISPWPDGEGVRNDENPSFLALKLLLINYLSNLKTDFIIS